MNLLLITMCVFSMMVLIHICSHLQDHSHPWMFLFVLRAFVWKFDFMAESDYYGIAYFSIFLKIDVSLPDVQHSLNFNRAGWVHFDHLCKEKLTVDTIELYEEPYCFLYKTEETL